MANQKFDLSKQEWRNRLKTIRQSISSSRREQAAAQACRKLKEWTQVAHWVLSFASVGSEINLWSLNQELAVEGRLVLPRLVSDRLLLFQVTTMDHLELHTWGFLEPSITHCLPIDYSQIDIALIPGLGFDFQTKHRLGYGQGYFDRLLALSTSTQTWGVGFLEQAVENLPHTHHDIPLHQIYLF
jgi:5-formyltetrahydrofolate cyclo-ligase